MIRHAQPRVFGLPLAIEREDSAHRAVDGGGHACRLFEFYNSTAEPGNLQPVATFQIKVHRGGHLRWEAVKEGKTVLGKSGAESDSLCAADSDCLAHDNLTEVRGPEDLRGWVRLVTGLWS